MTEGVQGDARLISRDGGGPVALVQTAGGMVYLYEASHDDVRDYAGFPEAEARGRWKHLLPRIASRGGAGPLGEDLVAALTGDDLEKLAAQYLGSPRNLRKAQFAAQPRRDDESAVAYLDRLLRDAPAIEPQAPLFAGDAPPGLALPPSPARVVPWALAALVMGLVLSGLAALFTYRAFEGEQAMQRDAQALRAEVAQLRSAVEKQAADAKTQWSAERADHTALHQRLAALEEETAKRSSRARITRSPDRSAEAARRATKDAKTRERPRR